MKYLATLILIMLIGCSACNQQFNVEPTPTITIEKIMYGYTSCNVLEWYDMYNQEVDTEGLKNSDLFTVKEYRYELGQYSTHPNALKYVIKETVISHKRIIEDLKKDFDPTDPYSHFNVWFYQNHWPILIVDGVEYHYNREDNWYYTS